METNLPPSIVMMAEWTSNCEALSRMPKGRGVAIIRIRISRLTFMELILSFFFFCLRTVPSLVSTHTELRSTVIVCAFPYVYNGWGRTSRWMNRASWRNHRSSL